MHNFFCIALMITILVLLAFKLFGKVLNTVINSWNFSEFYFHIFNFGCDISIFGLLAVLQRTIFLLMEQCVLGKVSSIVNVQILWTLSKPRVLVMIIMYTRPSKNLLTSVFFLWRQPLPENSMYHHTSTSRFSYGGSHNI